MKTLGLFALLAALAGSQGSPPLSVLDTLPPCPAAESAPTNNWRTESFEGATLALPRDFRNDAPCCFDHGGKAWTNGRVTVTLTKGYFGPTSFVDFASGCRAVVRGRSVL